MIERILYVVLCRGARGAGARVDGAWLRQRGSYLCVGRDVNGVAFVFFLFLLRLLLGAEHD